MPRRPAKRVTFSVTFALPDGATIANARDYVRDAVASWRGSLRPPGGYDDMDSGDPMFNLDGVSVEVRHQRPKRRSAI